MESITGPEIADPAALDKRQAVLSRSPSLSSSPSSNDSELVDIPASPSNTSLPSRPSGSISELEAKFYYYGLHSKPILVARTGNAWEEPTPEAYLRPKEIKPVSRHSSLNAVWEDDLAHKIHDILKSKEVQWTSTDVVRIGFVGEAVLPTVLWIGVIPHTLSGEMGLAVARECKEELIRYQILGIEVEIRESIVTRCHNGSSNTGPSFLESHTSYELMAELTQPLTTTMGSSICNHRSPGIEGTGGFYVTASDTQTTYLVTARHVLLPPKSDENMKYEYKFASQPKIRVALFGTAHFKSYAKSITDKIQVYEDNIPLLENRRRDEESRLRDGTFDPAPAAASLREIDRLVDTANSLLPELRNLNKDLDRWREIDNRIIGHLRFSPPIDFNVGPGGYTQDYALIELDTSKINKANFTGNTIDLGVKLSGSEMKAKLSPNPKNHHTFTYPSNRLLKVRGTIPDVDMALKTETKDILDRDDDNCLIVMKRGKASGLTLGRANGIYSYVRIDLGNSTVESKEWSICSYDKESGPFSVKGDSGAAVVDHSGRLGGLLTGGAGLTDTTDLTYVTPIGFIIDSLKANGFKVTTEVICPK